MVRYREKGCLVELFHGSYLAVARPRIIESNRMFDFGTGFYTTTDKNHAYQFTRKFLWTGKPRIVSAYPFDFEKACKALAFLSFQNADFDWLNYVVGNRSGKGAAHDFDFVIDPVANDRVYDVVEAFELGDYTADEAVVRLESYKLTDHVVFKSAAALQYLHFLEAHEVTRI
jgi:hypothetical protein